MTSLLLACALTQVINYTDTWTKTDKANMGIAKKRCVEHYSDSPCLKKFIKVEFQTYRAVCGSNL